MLCEVVFTCKFIMRIVSRLNSQALSQGRRKQSPDGQAQLDVSGEVVNNLHGSAHGKNLDHGIFSNEEALSLYFSFKLDS